MWYSPSVRRTNLHYDSYQNFLCVASGVKTVFLFAPDQGGYLYREALYSQSANHCKVGPAASSAPNSLSMPLIMCAHMNHCLCVCVCGIARAGGCISTRLREAPALQARSWFACGGSARRLVAHKLRVTSRMRLLTPSDCGAAFALCPQMRSLSPRAGFTLSTHRQARLQ